MSSPGALCTPLATGRRCAGGGGGDRSGEVQAPTGCLLSVLTWPSRADSGR